MEMLMPIMGYIMLGFVIGAVCFLFVLIVIDNYGGMIKRWWLRLLGYTITHEKDGWVYYKEKRK